jgi:heat shock protein HslJ
MQNDSTLLGTGKSFVNQYSVLFIYNKYKDRLQTEALSQTQLAGDSSLINEEVLFLSLISQTFYVNRGSKDELLELVTSQLTLSNKYKVLYFKKKSAAN